VFDVLRHHWPEYLMEGAGLGLFMISAGAVTTLFEYPGSPLNHAIGSAFVRRSLIGLGMGLTAIGLIYSPWGQQSGAHLNPAVTLTFLRLGKVHPHDASFYVVAPDFGGTRGRARGLDRSTRKLPSAARSVCDDASGRCRRGCGLPR